MSVVHNRHITYYSTANSGITINIQHIIQAFSQKLIAYLMTSKKKIAFELNEISILGGIVLFSLVVAFVTGVIRRQIATTNDEVMMDEILMVRNITVILDRDLAELYGIETKRLKKRNRFGERQEMPYI